MWFLSTLKKRRTASARSHRPGYQPNLEALEDRSLLSAGDILLGYATNTSGSWTFTFAETTFGLASGSVYTFFAQAVDSNGVLSDPIALALQAQ